MVFLFRFDTFNIPIRPSRKLSIFIFKNSQFSFSDQNGHNSFKSLGFLTDHGFDLHILIFCMNFIESALNFDCS